MTGIFKKILGKFLLSSIRMRHCGKGIVMYAPSNIYPTAKIGHNVSIGAFTEVGHEVEIGDRTRIGKGVFIPQGVTIGRDCFVGPHVCFSNDNFPPSLKKDWKKTRVGNRVSLGAGVSVKPGVEIGDDALVGMGAVVTKNIPSGEIWAGVPAKFLKRKEAE